MVINIIKRYKLIIIKQLALFLFNRITTDGSWKEIWNTEIPLHAWQTWLSRNIRVDAASSKDMVSKQKDEVEESGKHVTFSTQSSSKILLLENIYNLSMFNGQVYTLREHLWWCIN